MKIEKCRAQLEASGFYGTYLAQALELIGDPPARPIHSILINAVKQGYSPLQSLEMAKGFLEQVKEKF